MKSKSQTAYEIIKEKIISGELAPLSNINEGMLQSELDLGRTPIHEALLLLRDEGFIYSYPRKGTIVSEITIEVIKSVYEIRSLVEPTLTKNAIGQIPDEWLEDIRLRLMNPILDDSPENYIGKGVYLSSLDTELHTRILETSNNIFLKSSLKTVYDHTRRMRLKTIVNPTQTLLAQKEHIAIVEALLAHDETAVWDVIVYHIQRSREMTFKTLTQQW